jgi:hypothetical protein
VFLSSTMTDLGIQFQDGSDWELLSTAGAWNI